MTQKQRILDYLKAGKVLTRLNSWVELGIIEAPARICELKQDGVPIDTNFVYVINRYGEKCRIAKWSISKDAR